MLSVASALAFANSLVMPDYRGCAELCDGPNLDLCELFAGRGESGLGEGGVVGNFEESATSAVGPPGGATGAALDLLTGTGAVGPPGGTTGAPLELQAGVAQAPGQAPT